MKCLTLEEVKNYLNVYDDTEDDYINELIEGSQIYIDSMVGTDYKNDENLVKLSQILQRKIISDMYDNRGTEVANNTKRDVMVTSILDKLSNADEVQEDESNDGN